ncbi:TniQ family protein [Enterobacter cloacae]|uniref:TniQ family protein n=1 Tax=Enterobacter cloacae TaxID=550 RepID=UPI0034A414CC
MSGKITYHSDETLHSFIFRVCLVNGVEQYADVTGHNSRWRKTIHLNKNIAKFFKYYNDHDFLLLIRNSWQACKSAKMFSDPTEYMSDLKNLYTKGPRKGGIDKISHIKYCMDCIIESIKENGYGYFKSSWHYQHSEKCITHNKALTIASMTLDEKPCDTLKTILRGKHPVGSYSVLSVTGPIKENIPPMYISVNEYDTLPYDNGEFIYIADCLKREIIKFVLSFPGEFPKMSVRKDRSPQKTIQQYRRSYLSTDPILARIIRCFFEENFVPFKSFWKENAVKTSIPCGIIDINEIVEHTYIFRKMNTCRMCNSETCPVKKRALFPQRWGGQKKSRQ